MSGLIDVLLPADQVEGTRSQVQRWLKAVGEAAKRDEPLVEIETDKVTVEVPAPADGVLAEIVAPEGTDVAPGALLARMQEVAAGAGLAARAPRRRDARRAEACRAGEGRGEITGRAEPGGAPAARGTRPQRGIHTGQRRRRAHHGRRRARRRASRGERPSLPPYRRRRSSPGRGASRIRPMRRRIAAHMVESLLRTAPHVTTVFQADMTAVLADRARRKPEFEQRGYSLTLTAYFVAACVAAIREVPEANARWTEDAILVHERIDIGIGTALPERGLVVPVIRDAGRLDLAGIAAALGTLVQKARDDALTPADLQGGTFTISNHGVSGSLVAAPIVINQPQSAILGVGKLEKRAVVASEGGEDRVVVRPCCYVTLTIDHRVLDGHQANRFMETLVRRLEAWA